MVVTLGDRGMLLVGTVVRPHHVPAVRRAVSDVTGAGDTAVAVMATALAAGATLQPGGGDRQRRGRARRRRGRCRCHRARPDQPCTGGHSRRQGAEPQRAGFACRGLARGRQAGRLHERLLRPVARRAPLAAARSRAAGRRAGACHQQRCLGAASQGPGSPDRRRERTCGVARGDLLRRCGDDLRRGHAARDAEGRAAARPGQGPGLHVSIPSSVAKSSKPTVGGWRWFRCWPRNRRARWWSAFVAANSAAWICAESASESTR